VNNQLRERFPVPFFGPAGSDLLIAELVDHERQLWASLHHDDDLRLVYSSYYVDDSTPVEIDADHMLTFLRVCELFACGRAREDLDLALVGLPDDPRRPSLRLLGSALPCWFATAEGEALGELSCTERGLQVNIPGIPEPILRHEVEALFAGCST
jgi:hypothetical protein